MKRLIVISIVVLFACSSVYAGSYQASCWKPKPKCIPPQQTLTAEQGGTLNVSTMAVGWKKCGYHKSPSIVKSHVSGVVSRSAEANGKNGVAATGSTSIFQQNASAGKGGIAANELSQGSGGAAEVSKNGLKAETGSMTSMKSLASGNATASQSFVNTNDAIAIGTKGVAATGEVVGVVMINTAIGGGIASSSVNVAGGQAASVK